MAVAEQRISMLGTYFGGCSPGLLAHLSRFWTTLSWLGRVGGFCSFGVRGCLVSWVMAISLTAKLGIPA